MARPPWAAWLKAATVGDVSTEELSSEPTGAAPEAVSSGGDADAAVDVGEIRDELPEDLDAHGLVGPYLFPNNNRRRIPGVLYLVLAITCIGGWFAAGEDAVRINDGVLWGAVALALVGLYHLIAGWDLAVDEHEALVAATTAVGFPVGHASAQLGWRGLRSRPTWRILLYSAETPPASRGLALVDGVDGHVVQHFIEDNPEDWSALS